jgi:hypothetical protein
MLIVGWAFIKFASMLVLIFNFSVLWFVYGDILILKMLPNFSSIGLASIPWRVLRQWELRWIHFPLACGVMLLSQIELYIFFAVKLFYNFYLKFSSFYALGDWMLFFFFNIFFIKMFAMHGKSIPKEMSRWRLKRTIYII